MNQRKVQYGSLTVEISDDDVARLRIGRLLNENLVDFFLCKRVRENAADSGTTVVSTRWYSTLSEERRIAHITELPSFVKDSFHVNFLDVQHMHPEWFRSEFVFVPMNVNENHWVLAVVINRNASSLGSDSHRHCAIVLFDSHRDEQSPALYDAVAHALRCFMNCEWYFRYVRASGKVVREFTPETCPFIACGIEQQSNGCDCGLYVIESCVTFLREMDDVKSHTSLTDGDIEWLRVYFSDKITVDGKSYRVELQNEVRTNVKDPVVDVL